MLDLDVPAPAATTKMGVDGRFAVPGKAAVCSTLEKSQVSLSRKLWLSLGCPPADALVLVCKAPKSRNFSAAGLRKVQKVTLKLYAMEAAFAIRAEGAWLRDSLARNRRSLNIDSSTSSVASLEMLALRALRGRGYRVGQMVRLPLLGVSALFEVIAMTTTDCEDENASNNDEEILEIDEMTVKCKLLGRDINETGDNTNSRDTNNKEEEEEEEEEDHIGSAVRRARAAGAALKSISSYFSKNRNVLTFSKSVASRHLEVLCFGVHPGLVRRFWLDTRLNFKTRLFLSLTGRSSLVLSSVKLKKPFAKSFARRQN